MSNAAAGVAPIRSASDAAADGVWYGCVTVATMTAPIWEPVTPAALSASPAAAADMSTTVSSGAAKSTRDDAGALTDPLVGGVDVLADLVVGDHALGAVAANAPETGMGCSGPVVQGRARLGNRRRHVVVSALFGRVVRTGGWDSGQAWVG